MREVFSDVPNPAILLRWFIFLKLVKLWLNPGPEKTPLILILWPKQHSVKAFFSVSARHCKRALVPNDGSVGCFFFSPPSFLVKTFAVKLNKPPKISLVQELNWLTAWPISPLEKQWSRWDIGSDLRLDHRIFIFIFLFGKKKGVWFHVMDVCSFKPAVLFKLIACPFCCYNICFCSSSRDRDGKSAKDEKGKNYYMQESNEVSELAKAFFFLIWNNLIHMFVRRRE